MKKIFDSPVLSFQRWLEDYKFSDYSILWFRRGVYLLLLLKMLLISPGLHVFYNHALTRHSSGSWLSVLLFLPAAPQWYDVLWFAACGFVAAMLVVRPYRILSFCVFIISLNYLYVMHMAQSLADSLLHFFIFFLIFIKEGAVKGTPRQLINNICLLIMQVHFCLLYFLNGFGKLVVTGWQDGNYMQLIWNIPYYANLQLIPDWFLTPPIRIATTWAVIIFEIAFALLIWFRPFRKWLFLSGILFHIGIALFLSLPDFALTMLVGYLLFADLHLRPQSNFPETDIK